MVNYTQWRSLVDGTKQPFIPDGAVDTFESYLYEDENKTLSDYYTDDLTNFSRQQITVFEGSYSLTTDNTAGVDLISNSGLPRYPAAGETVVIYMRADSTGARSTAATFASGTGANPGVVDDGYVIDADWGNGWLIQERNSGFSNGYEGYTGTASANTWYRAELTFDGNGTLTGTVTDTSTSTEVFSDTLTVNDKSGTDGIHFGQFNSGANCLFDGVEVL